MKKTTAPSFKKGDKVKWSSQASGVTKTKSGTIIEVVPAFSQPKDIHHNFRRCGVRDHKSYVVGVVGVRYRPLVKNLKLKS
jgi:hypothetical protein